MEVCPDNGGVSNQHDYEVDVVWRPEGAATTGYGDYTRDHEVRAEDRPILAGSADVAFRGSLNRWNPEQLFVASISQCHMLWYLHLCADAGVVVVGYRDRPRGTLAINGDGSGQFQTVVLRPEVFVRDGDMIARAEELHERAHEMCFIARSVSCEVHVQSSTREDRRTYRSQGTGSSDEL